jgi:hypothetical protein
LESVFAKKFKIKKLDNVFMLTCYSNKSKETCTFSKDKEKIIDPLR